MNDDKNETHIDVDGVMYMGDAVKAIETSEGLKVSGMLVRFGTENDTDLVDEYFDENTDFDIDEYPVKKSIYFHHAMDGQLKTRRLSRGILTKDNIGIWIESILEERDEYE